MRILLVEDDQTTREFVLRGLREEGHTADGREALAHAVVAAYDVLIVDRMLPGLDGLSLVKALRSANVTAPAIFLTALGNVEDRIEGLRAGGDDYLVKPFAFAELSTRIAALARRPALQENETVLRAADVEVDLVRRTVTCAGQAIDLLPREFALLEHLMRRKGRVQTRTMLLESVWGITFEPQTNVVEIHISRLRAKLDRPFDRELIATVRGAGYRFEESATVAGLLAVRRLIRATPIRQALLLVTIFALVNLATLGGTYLKMRQDLAARLALDLAREVASYDLSATANALSLIVAAKARVTDPNDKVLVFLSAGGGQVGNALAVLQSGGLRLTPINGGPDLSNAGYLHEVRRLSDGVLVAAVSLQPLVSLRSTFLTLIGLSLLPTTAVALLLASVLAQRGGSQRSSTHWPGLRTATSPRAYQRKRGRPTWPASLPALTSWRPKTRPRQRLCVRSRPTLRTNCTCRCSASP